MAAPAQAVIAEGAAGARRLADELWRYWSVAIEPHWRELRAVLEDDVAYRAGRLTGGGVDALLSSLHPEISVQGEILRIDKSRHSVEHDLAGDGLLLVPSVFAWPNLVVDKSPDRPASLLYACRGVGTLWGGDSRDPEYDDDALGALLGQSRAAILSHLTLPKSTTDLARELGQSPPSVSFHLSVLRRNGLVTSWRSGRRVLYRRTPLATALATGGGTGFGAGRNSLAETPPATPDSSPIESLVTLRAGCDGGRTQGVGALRYPVASPAWRPPQPHRRPSVLADHANRKAGIVRNQDSRGLTRRAALRAAATVGAVAGPLGLVGTAAAPAYAEPGTALPAATPGVTPFRLSVSESALRDLQRRLAAARFPERETVPDGSQGAPLERVRGLVEHWRTRYDWRRVEARLNGFGQFRTQIDGLGIHFLHVRSRHAAAVPVVLTHGWPGSVVEFLDMIGPLTDPTAYGGSAADAFHVVVPSLPGFGFSDRPTTTGGTSRASPEPGPS